MKVVWTRRALRDVRHIYGYVAEDSPFNAERLAARIIRRAVQIGTFPRSGRVVPEYGVDFIREVFEGRYRIIYRIDDGFVYVLRVFHSARQLR